MFFVFLEILPLEGGGVVQNFICKTRIVTGENALDVLKTLGIRRLFLVTDPYFHKNGTAQRIAQLTGAAQLHIFSEVKPDPDVELVAQTTAALKEFDPDGVIALGGGSAMDCAKATVHFSGKQVTFVAIPTTSGSGSEVTDFAVVTHGSVKHPLVDSALRPDVAILDSSLLQSLPKSLIADTGFDVLCHALEAYTATDANTFSDALAKESFCIAYANLPASYCGHAHVRGTIHEAATMAGLAFTQAGLGLCHAMAHALGGLLHLPHGRLNAILLPAIISCNANACAGKYAKLARSAGIAGAADTVAVRNLRAGLERLRRELHMPQTLKEAGIDPRQVWHHTPEIVTAVLADPCCKTNPMPVEDFMVRRILEEVTGRV
jgi:alcohol dehydrogenase class IV